jgi:hypothetical protein
VKTLETYLKENYDSQIIDFHAAPIGGTPAVPPAYLRASVDDKGETSFYIHPFDKNGETPEFIVYGNQLILKADKPEIPF